MAIEEKIDIKIENSDKSSASFFSCKFADKKVKNRAYVNALAASIVAKYLNNNGVKTDDVKNLYYVRKILEEFDIADIELKNIRIDVRAVFDESEIFIPKTHFEYNLLPDIYVIIKLDNDSHAELLGFIEPKIINKNNANREYYFVEKEKLSSISDLIHKIKDFKYSNTAQNLSDGEIEKSRNLMFDMLDNNISEGDKKNLIQNLLKSYELRDNFIELENFETISFSAANNSEIERPEVKPVEVIEEENSLENEINDLIPEDILPEEPIEEDVLQENLEDENQDNLEDLTDSEILNEETEEDIIEQEQNEIEDIEISPLSEQNNLEENSEIEEISQEDDIANLFNELPETEIENDKKEETPQDDFSIDNSDKDNDLLDTDELINNIDSLMLGEIEKTSGMTGLIAEMGETLLDDENQDVNIPSINDVIENNNQNYEEKFEPEEIIPEEIENTSEENSLLELDMEKNNFDIENESLETENIDNSDKINIEDVEIDELNFEDEEIKKDVVDIDTFEEKPIEQDDLDFSQTEKLSIEDFNEIEDLDNNTTNEILEETVSLDELSNIENTEQTENSGFGTTLLNSLQAEDSDISIEDSVDDLNLDEIDTLLNMQDDEFATEVEKVDENQNNEEIEEVSIDTNEIDGLLDLPLENVNEETEVEPETEIEENVEEPAEEEINIDTDEIDNILGLPQEDNNEDLTTSTESVLDEVDKLLNTSEENSDSTEEDQPENQEPIEETPISDTEISYLNETVINDFENSEVTNSETVTAEEEPEPDKETHEEEETTPESDENIDNLEMLFDEELTDDKIPEQYEEIDEPAPVPGIALNSNNSGNKKAILIAASLITLVVIGSLGIAVSHKKTSDEISTEQNVPAPISQNVQNETPAPPQEIPQNLPDINSQIPNTVQSKPVQQEAPKVITSQNPPKTTNTATSEAYMSVKGISWQVPDYLSYSDAMRTYLKTAGKSIKISLSSDLLLATEYAYSNKVKINLRISNSGSVQQATIVTSSGSTQIDKIVLQSVKSTLNVVKPPVSVIKTPEFSLTITINL